MMAPAANSGSANEQWRAVIQTCFLRRYQPEIVSDAFVDLAARGRTSGRIIADTVFQYGAQPRDGVDPLVPAYLVHLLQLRLLDTADVLDALLESSKYALKSTTNGIAQARRTSPPVIENVLNLLSNLFGTGDRPQIYAETVRVFNSLEAWIEASNAYETMLQIHNHGIPAPDPDVVTVFEALGVFTAVMLSSPTVKKHLRKSLAPAKKNRFVDTLNHFTSTLVQWSQHPISPRLELLTRSPPLGGTDANGSAVLTATDIFNAVSDLPLATSRAGLYIYLNAALCSRPIVDDSAIISYLHARYPSDAQTMIIHMIVAAFDALANSLQRRESSSSILCHRSFNANKLPLLLMSLSSGLYPSMTAEHCIQLALARIDIHPFPPLSANSTGINEVLKESRQEFLQACHLHQLMSESAVASALSQQTTTKIQKTSRYTKDSLVSQSTNSIRRIEELAAELEKTQGNAGAISLALGEMLQNLCNAKETMSLKTVCNALSRRLGSVDIVLQYVPLENLLMPLCNVLDNWTLDEDQSELQPAYEEFASILLLVLALVHRYDLGVDELDGISQGTFAAKLLRQLSYSTPVEDLDEEQSKQLGKWIKGLYATDEKGETSGISDETMSGCPPQAFYLLSPTLFEQSVHACKAGVLNQKTLQGGLEFLLEPFLLPSVVGGLAWLAKYAWKDSKDVNILMQILDKLIRPSSISGDADAMHKTILAISAKTLVPSLQDLHRAHPNRKDIPQLINVLKPFLDKQRSIQSSAQELKEWSSASGGLEKAISDLVAQLTIWGSQSDLQSIPTSYTYRMIKASIDYAGVETTLTTIISEVGAQTSMGLGSNALEVGTALICAPHSPDSLHFLSVQSRPRLSLQQALKLRLGDNKYLLRTDPTMVETMVRLGRLVDAQSVVSQLQMPMTALTNIGTDELMQGIDMTGADLTGNTGTLDQATNLDATSTADFAAVMDSSMGLGPTSAADMSAMGDPNAISLDLPDNLFGTGQDMDFSMGTTTQQNQQQGQDGQNQGQAANAPNEDDIFAGLDFGGMDDFNF